MGEIHSEILQKLFPAGAPSVMLLENSFWNSSEIFFLAFPGASFWTTPRTSSGYFQEPITVFFQENLPGFFQELHFEFLWELLAGFL